MSDVLCGLPSSRGVALRGENRPRKLSRHDRLTLFSLGCGDVFGPGGELVISDDISWSVVS